ncbi:putative holin-like toxin [Paenibacillus sp. UMB4589-SE434]
MTVYEALTLMLAFGTFVVLVLSFNKKK